MVQIRGDWEFLANILGLQNWADKHNMCWLCAASNSIPRLMWHDMGAAAGWRATKRTHNTYLEDLRGDGLPTPPIIANTIGLSITCITIDTLHAVDLGVTAHLIGNIFLMCEGECVEGQDI